MKLPSIGFNAGTIALGAAAVFVGPAVMALAVNLAKSLAKTGIKTGMILYEQGREIAAEGKETLEDLTAEARAEVSGGAKKAKK
ncbi:MAG: DUF5132 domain-containing protein [Desulfatiglandaceae bacterium]